MPLVEIALHLRVDRRGRARAALRQLETYAAAQSTAGFAQLSMTLRTQEQSSV